MYDMEISFDLYSSFPPLQLLSTELAYVELTAVWSELRVFPGTDCEIAIKDLRVLS